MNVTDAQAAAPYLGNAAPGRAYDLIILGGGCAGLSLAMRLAAQGDNCPRTLVLEARPVYSDDRTWCFWDDGSMWLNELVRHSWRFMTITTPDAHTTMDCGAARYRMLPAGAFYAEAQARIGRNDRIELRLGSSIDNAPGKSGEVWCFGSGAAADTARWVVDTRPRRMPRHGDATLWQSFSGHEVICDRPVFDPGRMDLMDFSETEPNRISFTYVLPTSSTSALIETTVFDQEPFTEAAMASALSQATIRRVGGSPYSVTRAERGVLPMGGRRHLANRDSSWITAGLHAGGARPSSGFAFRRIQTWAQACATRMASGSPPISHAPDPILLQAMDSLFLSVIAAHREMAPSLFHAIFAKGDAQRVIRFMSDGGTTADYIALAATLPTGLFLRQIPTALASLAKRKTAPAR